MVPAPAQPGEDVTVELRLGEEGADFLPAVTAAFSLDPSRKMLEYEFRSSYLGTEATAVLHLLAADGTTTPVFDLAICNEAYGDYDGTLYVTCTNHWLRHLSAYVQFLDGNGQPIVPTDWPSTEWASIGGVFEKIFGCEPSKKFLALLPPVGLLCGMIVLDNPTTLEIRIPRNAESVRLLWGGLGVGGEYDNDVCLMGIIMTSVMELAVPMIMLVRGGIADDEPGWLDKLILDKKIIKQLLLAAVAAGLSGTYIARETRKTGDVGPVLTSMADMIGPFLFETGLKAYLMRKAGQAALLSALPFIGQAFRIYSAVVNISKLVRTTLAVLQSPFYYRTEIKRAMNLDVEIAPGPLHKFPALARRYRVMVTYDKSATVQIMDGDLPRLGVLSDPFHVQFYEVPAGGRLRIFVFLYAANGWQAGQGVSDWLPAKPQNGNLMLVKDVQVLENEIPLTAASVYAHQARLAYQQGSHVWLASSQPPTATPYTGGGTAAQVLRRESITLAQSPAALGYCWQATGLHIARDTDPSGPPVDEALYTAQSISILADPEKGYATPAVGYSQPVGLVDDLSTSNEGDGRNFFMQGSAGGEFHLRQVRPAFNRETGKVQPPKFPAHATESWGRFPQRLDCYVVHPQGYVIGLVSQPAKLFICQLPPAALPDDQSPRATLASGEGMREGLLLNPHALAVGLDGAILVLEGKRIQAFDLYGNPVPYFRDPVRPDQKSSALYLTQPAGTFYLDLTVEAKGYLYVLSRRGAGRQPADYHLTIYTPDGAQLVDTPQVAAERLTVGLDRSVYTLNYETLQGHQGRPEPSISQWVPPAPAL